MLNAIKTKMQAAMNAEGVAAEITFCRTNMFSILVEDAEQFAKAKSILARLPNAKFDSEETDDEIGNIAFYCF